MSYRTNWKSYVKKLRGFGTTIIFTTFQTSFNLLWYRSRKEQFFSLKSKLERFSFHHQICIDLDSILIYDKYSLFFHSPFCSILIILDSTGLLKSHKSFIENFSNSLDCENNLVSTCYSAITFFDQKVIIWASELISPLVYMVTGEINISMSSVQVLYLVCKYH